MVQQLTTRPGSRPEIDDADALLGKVMASQVRIERAWEAMKHERETDMRTVVGVQRSLDEHALQLAEVTMMVRDLVTTSRRTHRTIVSARALAPVLLGLVEAARYVLAHLGH